MYKSIFITVHFSLVWLLRRVRLWTWKSQKFKR